MNLKKLLVGLLFYISSTCYAVVNVEDYLSYCEGYSQDICFENAVQAANLTKEPVRVPTGFYSLTAPTSVPLGGWLVDPYVELVSPSDWPTGNENLSHLSGIVFQVDSDTETGLIVGDMDFNDYIEVRNSAIPHAAINAISYKGQPAISARVMTKNQLTPTEGGIGLDVYALNNREGIKGVVYGAYVEAIKWPNAGTTFGMEMNNTCYGSVEPALPSGVWGNDSGLCVPLYIGGAVGSGPLNGIYDKYPTSAAILIAGGTATSSLGKNVGFERVFVVTSKSMESSISREFMSIPDKTYMAWHTSGNSPQARIYGDALNGNGRFKVKLRNTSYQERDYTFHFAHFSPESSGIIELGQPSQRWERVWTTLGLSTISDIREKVGISQLTSGETCLAKNLEVKSFTLKSKDKKSFGIIAQEVLAAFIKCDLNYQDYSLIHYDEVSERYSVDYDQVNILMLQSKEDSDKISNNRLAIILLILLVLVQSWRRK